MSIQKFVKSAIRIFLNENYQLIDKESFEDALLKLATLDLEDDQVIYPKYDNKKISHLFGSNNYDLYILNRKSLPSSGAFEIVIENNDGEVIGFIRGTKRDKTISFNFIHIQEDYRGQNIGTEIYIYLLDKGYIIKSDSEITDGTYSVYLKILNLGYQPIIFQDGRVGLKK